MADLVGCNLRNELRVCSALRAFCVLAGLGLGSAMACSEGGDVTYQVSANAADPSASPADGVLTASPIPDDPISEPIPEPIPESPVPESPIPSGDVSGSPSPAAPQASGAGAPPQENPPPEQAGPEEAPAASGGEPQPSATETNFFGAGCRGDADCGENRRCEFPVDAEADAAASPGPEGAGSPDAGADAAVPETLVPRGHCVAR